jgi:tyrosine-protein kinase Etk/Wzc
MPAPAPASSLLSLLDNLMQHARLFAGVWLAALLLGLAFLVLVAPVYRAETLVQIESRSPRTLATSLAQVQANPQEPQGFMQGEIEILRSRDIVSKAIAQTQADIDTQVANRLPIIGDWYARTFARGSATPLPPPLDAPYLRNFSWGGETLRLAHLRVPRAQYGEPLWLVADKGSWTLLDNGGRRLATGAVDQAVAFTVGGEAGSLQVSALEASPGTQFRLVANDPLAVYDEFARNLRIDEAGRQSGVIRIALNHRDPRFAVDFLDALTAAYLAHHLQVNSGEASRALGFLESQLPAVKRELDRAEEALKQYRTGTNTINVPLENENALRRIADLERERVTLELKKQQLGQRYTMDYPESMSVQKQLATVAAELQKVRGQMRQSPQQERDVVRLQRDVQVNTQLYTALLNNAQELRVAKAGMTGNARLVDAAGVSPRPVKPVPATVMSVAFGLGLVLALATVLLARMLRPSLRTAAEVEQHIGMPTLASIPESAGQLELQSRPWRRALRQQPQVLALRSPSDPAVESLRGLRNHVALAAHEFGSTNVLITAATADAGKTFVAANLAALTAAAGRRVLLVDLDLRAPRVHSLFGIDRDSEGIVDVVAEHCELREAIVRDVIPGLDLLLPGRFLGGPGELLMQARFNTLMQDLSCIYDHIVIDSAPVLPVGDALVLGRLARTTYVVVRSEVNSMREVRDATRRLASAGVAVDGLILNGVKRTRLANLPYRSYFTPAVEARAAH